MGTMRVEANELHGTDVNIVSLVKRAATRLPFRITKEDSAMLDISKMFLRKGENVAGVLPAVHSIIVRKDAKNAKEFTAMLAKAGFEVGKPVIKDDCVFYAQKVGDPSADAILIKSNQNVVVIVQINK